MERAFTHRNRLRIVLLTILAAINYWIATCCAAIVVALTIVIWLVFEGGAVPEDLDDLKWFGVGLAVLVAGAVVVGTLLAMVRVPFQRRSLERRVLVETGARIAAPDDHVRTRNLLEGLAIAAGVPVPRFAVIDDAAPNSFGVGTRPSKAIIGVTTGLIESFSRDELEAVLAYEVSRIRSYDVALASWTVALTGGALAAVDADGEELLKAVVGWVPRRLASRLQIWALRGQTEGRDRAAIHFTRHPDALISALEVLHADERQIRCVSRATAPLWIEVPVNVVARRTRSSRALAEELLLPQRIAALRAELGAMRTGAGS